jgi:hypothetical protein
MIHLRPALCVTLFCGSLFCGLLPIATAQQTAIELPDAPRPSAEVLVAMIRTPAASSSVSSSTASPFDMSFDPDDFQQSSPRMSDSSDPPVKKPDENGKPVSRAGQQPKRILGLMPNYRSVSSGTTPPKPTFKHNFVIATHQSFDYSSFIFLGITSMSAEGLDSHPALGKGVAGFWGYTWRGFLDKTDGTYLGAWLLPSILHEDTRYYAMGEGSKWKRAGYVISRQAVARTYGGRQTPNIAGLSAKVLTQVISRNYYPAGSTDFGTLATKFGYGMARDVGFTMFREFYPDIAVHVLHRKP